MDYCMIVTGDIIVKMIEHGSFDKPATGEAGTLDAERMSQEICKAYTMIFETISHLRNKDTEQPLYLGENQI